MSVLISGGPGRFGWALHRKTKLRAFTDKGYFSQADPDAELRPVRRKKEVDLTKREGLADFIWNTDWVAQLEYEEQLKEEEKRRAEETAKKPHGFLNLSRATNLDDLSVDMSEALRQTEETGLKSTISSSKKKTSSYLPPSQRESSAWVRSTKFATKTVTLELEEEQRSAAEGLEKYDDETSQILLWNAGLMAISFSATYAFYSQDVALSYVTGACGGIVYLRLLKKSVEGIGGYGGLSSIAAQPRLLVPVILVLLFNRWNTLAADRVGVHLELLPMLVGFFTYKAAVIGRQSLRLFQDVLKDLKGNDGRNV